MFILVRGFGFYKGVRIDKEFDRRVRGKEVI